MQHVSSSIRCEWVRRWHYCNFRQRRTASVLQVRQHVARSRYEQSGSERWALAVAFSLTHYQGVSPIADNVAITAGAGTSIATDDISGVQWQRVKIGHGQDGSATDVSSASPLPVTAPAATRTTHSISVGLETDALMSSLTTLTPKFFTQSVTASSTDVSVVAAVGGKKLRVVALVVQCGATATDVTFESSTTTRKHKVLAGANGGQVLDFNPVGWFETATGESLTITTSSGSTTEISGVYVEV